MAEKHSFTSRTKARRRAADVVFEADQRGMGSRPGMLFDLLRERKVLTAAQTPLPEYSIFLIEGVASELRRIDHLIADHLKDREIDRIPALDLAVMRVAVFEFLSEQADVMPTVAIDEAVKIARVMSTEDSPRLVNAVLDAIRRTLEAPAWQRERVTDYNGNTAEDHFDAEPAIDEAPAPAPRRDVEEMSFAEFAAGLAEGDIVPVETLPSQKNGEFDGEDFDELLDEY